MLDNLVIFVPSRIMSGVRHPEGIHLRDLAFKHPER
jgi:hypothetical protein